MFSFGGKQYTVGILVQSNFGSLQDLNVCNDPLGEKIARIQAGQTQDIAQEAVRAAGREWFQAAEDKGSIMIVLATDVPLDTRQRRRGLKRAAVGLIRTGSYLGHGSGDVLIGFTNGNFMPEREEEELIHIECFPENQMNLLFRASSEATEEAIYNSLVYADKKVGIDGKIYHSLREYLS